jgi:dethiobiotin synthetase
LGCINHALLTLAYLEAHGMPLRGAVLVDRWRASSPDERANVERALAGRAPILGHIEHDLDARRSVANAAATLSRSHSFAAEKVETRA